MGSQVKNQLCQSNQDSKAKDKGPPTGSLDCATNSTELWIASWVVGDWGLFQIFINWLLVPIWVIKHLNWNLPCLHAQSFICVGLFVTPWTEPCQAPLPMGFSRQEYWSGLPFPSPRDLPDPGIRAASPALAGGFFTTEPPGKPESSHRNWHKWQVTKSTLPPWPQKTNDFLISRNQSREPKCNWARYH